MNLTPREKDKLLVSMAAMVARNRLLRGVKLNHPEAIALITDYVVEGARDKKGQEVTAQVTSQIQSSQGRMVFARVVEDPSGDELTPVKAPGAPQVANPDAATSGGAKVPPGSNRPRRALAINSLGASALTMNRSVSSSASKTMQSSEPYSNGSRPWTASTGSSSMKRCRFCAPTWTGTTRSPGARR